MKLLLKLSVIFLMTLSMMTFAGDIPANTGIVAEDCINAGDTYDFDALLKSGKHIVVHQTFSG
jgi:hypothetical protein